MYGIFMHDTHIIKKSNLWLHTYGITVLHDAVIFWLYTMARTIYTGYAEYLFQMESLSYAWAKPPNP